MKSTRSTASIFSTLFGMNIRASNSEPGVTPYYLSNFGVGGGGNASFCLDWSISAFCSSGLGAVATGGAGAYAYSNFRLMFGKL